MRKHPRAEYRAKYLFFWNGFLKSRHFKGKTMQNHLGKVETNQKKLRHQAGFSGKR